VITDGKRPPEPVMAICRECGYTWQICGAHPDRITGPCGQVPDKGRNRCYIHGRGGRPIEHGRRSGSLPIRLAERYEEAIQDPALISMRENLALMDAMIGERLERMRDLPDCFELWDKALSIADEANRAVESGDLLAAGEAIREFASTLRAARDSDRQYEQLEGQVRAMMLEQAKLSDVEIKALDRLMNFVTAKELNLVLATIVGILKEEGDPAKARDRIIAAIRNFAGRRALGR
jgi:hypothetical protein